MDGPSQTPFPYRTLRRYRRRRGALVADARRAPAFERRCREAGEGRQAALGRANVARS
jgi:hypothetical protein